MGCTAKLLYMAAASEVENGQRDKTVPYVVRMCFEGFHFVHRIVIEHTNHHVIRSGDDPLLAYDEFGGAHCRRDRLGFRWAGACLR